MPGIEDFEFSNQVNGIPSAHSFLEALGRTGLNSVHKKRDPGIDRIKYRLGAAEAFRGQTTDQAVELLRGVRVECYRYVKDLPRNHVTAELPWVKELNKRIYTRLTDIVGTQCGLNAARSREEIENIKKFEEFYDTAYEQGRQQPKGIMDGLALSLYQDYLRERNNPQHFEKNVPYMWGYRNSPLALEDWYNTCYKWDKEDRFKGQNPFGGEPPEYTSPGVTYLDHNARAAYRITIQNGRVNDATGNPVHTANRTSSAGRGFGIFVIGMDKEFYLGTHQTDHFHHSSFFSGGAILCGGEIAVNQGTIVAMTNKTGHYRAGAKHMETALMLLEGRGVNLGQVAVQDTFSRRGQWYSGQDVLDAAGDVTNAGATIAHPQPVV